MRAMHVVSVAFVLLVARSGPAGEMRQAAPRRTDRRRGPGIPEGVEVLRDVVYGKGGGRDLKLDIYRPKERPAKRMPVLMWIHGGAWRAGNRGSGAGRLVPFAKKGFFCPSISYRFTQVAPFPAQIEDCKCAVRYLRAHAEEYNIDPDRIGVWGSSAGGHLVAMLGVTGNTVRLEGLEGEGGWEEYSSRVQAVCDWFGPADLLSMADQPSRMNHNDESSPEGKLIGGVVKDNPEKARRASPVTYVDGDDAPFLIMHGTKDMVVPFAQSEILCELLKAAGVDVTFVPIEGAGHGGRGFQSEEMRKLIADFFQKHLVDRPAAPAVEEVEVAPPPEPVPPGPSTEPALPVASVTDAAHVEDPPEATSPPVYVILLIVIAAVLAAAGGLVLRSRRRGA